MAGLDLKSYGFRKEREQTWRELDALVTRAEKDGVRALSPQDMHRLPILYRATLSSLSVARGISLDKNVLVYLESLSARAYFCVYGARGRPWASIVEFFTVSFPAAVRQARWHLFVSGLILFIGAAFGVFLTLAESDWYYTFVSDAMAQGRTTVSSTGELRSVLYRGSEGAKDYLHIFASFLFTHNASIGLLCFALGFALGVPVFLLLFMNGSILGAMTALYTSKGLSFEFLAWITVHGTTELLAVVVCAAAGLMLGGAVAIPGKRTRLESLSDNGRTAGRIVIGAVFMFLVAGLLEGFARQLVSDPGLRYTIGGVALVWWAGYFAFSGRGAAVGEETS